MAAYASSSLTALAGTYPATAQVDLGNQSADEFFAAVDTVSVAALSFDGVNDHVRLDSATYRTAQRNIRFSKMWARTVSGAAATVQIQSWSHA
jgi:hypothetical protein